jgi:hypothetical protein
MKTIRLFDDDGIQTKIASDAGNEMTVACMDILTQLEGQLGGPVDLRDLHYVLTGAVGTFICETVIRRRLGCGDEPPDETKRNYPRLSNGGEAFGLARTLVAGELFGWECEDSPTGHCLYDGNIDPMHDQCVHCGSPYERK